MNISISENLKAPTVIFISGLLDTCDIFRNNIQRVLAADYRIVGITIPGFDHDHPFFQNYSRSFPSSSCSLEERYAASTSHKEDESLFSFNTTSVIPFQSRNCNHPRIPISTTKVLPKRTMEDDRDERQHSLRNTRCTHFSSAPLSKRAGVSIGPDPVESNPHGNGATTLQTTEVVPMWAPRSGYSFQALVALLEIAIDTSLENHNYCPRAFIPNKLDAEDGTMHAQGIPPHQLPPYYPKPILIAHDLGCLLAYELLLARPRLFSRMIALDTGLKMPNKVFKPIAHPIVRPLNLSSISKKDPNHVPVCATPSQEKTMTVNGASTKAANAAPNPKHRQSSLHTSCKPSLKASGVPGTRVYSLTNAESNSSDSSPLSPSEGLTTTSSKSTAFTPHPQPHSVESPLGGASTDGNESAEALSLHPSQSSAPRQTEQISSEGENSIQRWLLWIVVLIGELVVVLCGMLLPVAVARWVFRIFSFLSNRPCYSYDPRYQFSPEPESSFQSFIQNQYVQHCLAAARGHHETANLVNPVEACLKSQPGAGSWIPSFLHSALSHFTGCNTFDDSHFNYHSLLNNFFFHRDQKECAKKTATDDLETPGTENSWCIFMVPFLKSACETEPQRTSSRSFPQRSCDSFVPVGRSTADVLHARNERTSPTRGGISSTQTPSSDAAAVNVAGLKPWTFFTSSALAEAGDASSRCVWDALTGVSPYCAYRDHSCAEDYYQGGRGYFNLGRLTNKTVGADPSTLPRLCSPPNIAAKSMGLLVKQDIEYKSYFFPPLRVSLKKKNAKNMSEEEGRVWARSYSSQYHELPIHKKGAMVSATASLGSQPDPVAHRGKMGTHKEVEVQVNFKMYWIYLCYRSSIFAAYFFTQRRARFSVPFEVVPALRKSNKTVRKSSTHRNMRKLRNDKRAQENSPFDSLTYKERTGSSLLVPESFLSPIPIPILFMYGGNKSAMQHTPQWCEYITSVKRAEDGISNVIRIEGGGHWFFAEPNHREEVGKYVLDFIRAPVK